MFVYFIQRKGLLDYTDPNSFNGKDRYLQDHLEAIPQQPENAFAYYREFLLPLFRCLNERERMSEQRQLFGNIPYLNGGIFDVHPLEQKYDAIKIDNTAFKELFAFFTKFTWHLDDRPSRKDDEINPDVLGYIFEKYINQKEMGAYYTKEDITGYISKNTIIPFIFEKVAHQHNNAFAPGGPIWSLLQPKPEVYIYEAMTHGVLTDLPTHIEAGVHDISLRANWNQPAEGEYALETETWREVVARRQRYREVSDLMRNGQISSINELITYNLDILKFATDVIDKCSDASLLLSFYNAIKDVTILDPTCGSGAFLFAALNILKPLYQVCLDRMSKLVKQHEDHEIKLAVDYLKIFQGELEHFSKHQGQQYFILKSIIVSNLYGVDIMEEAIEICRLRFFLNLVAQLKSPKDLEPLPDIDFNVLAGNTLIGFTSLDEVRQITQQLFPAGNTEEVLAIIEQKAKDAERAEQAFRYCQTEGINVDASAKQALQTILNDLRDDLNPYLATKYNIGNGSRSEENVQSAAYQEWLENYQPFHWWIKFHKIMYDGGFDVIIGNPPYVEYSEVRDKYRIKGYITEPSGNLYNYVLELCSKILRSPSGQLGVIVPLGGFSTERMASYQDFIFKRYNKLYLSYFSGDANPSVMFQGVKYRLCIILANHHERVSDIFTTEYNRWYADERAHLFDTLSYTRISFQKGYIRFAKIGDIISRKVLSKMLEKKLLLGAYIRKHGNGHINYHRSPVSWIRAMNFEPYFRSATRERSLDHLKDLYFVSQKDAEAIGAIISSTCFYYWFYVQGNGRDIAGSDITSFPIGHLDDTMLTKLSDIFNDLMEDLKSHSKPRVYNYKTSGRVEYQEFYPRYSKPIIDEIDRVLAQHYGFTPEELDYIINYDIKYRMGRDNGKESE